MAKAIVFKGKEYGRHDNQNIIRFFSNFFRRKLELSQN